jgi:hypothetical protein
MKMHETPDIEVLADEFETQEAIWNQISEDEAIEDDAMEYSESERAEIDSFLGQMGDKEEAIREAEFERLADEEQARFEARYQVVPGITLNGQPVRKDVESGEIVDDNGQPLNSCDALRIIDGVKDDPADDE